MTDSLGLSFGDIVLVGAICFVAGVVRGFSGFALSALVMAAATWRLPPIELIPMLWFLELGSSLMLARGSVRDADIRLAFILVTGTWVGLPVGLSLTTTLPVETSRNVVLLLILGLAALQLARIRIPAMATQPGTVAAGFLAGIATGLGNIGGMVVALYVLARGDAARAMRGTMVIILFAGSLGGFIYLQLFGVMTEQSALRGALFVLPTLLGVWIGSRLFNPAMERFYKPVCLMLLIGLASVGLIRMGVAA